MDKWELDNQVSFPLFLIQKQKNLYRFKPLYIFSFFIRNIKKEKNRKTIPSLYIPFFALLFGVIYRGKQIRNQTILCSFSYKQLSESINGICTRLTCFGIYVLYIKHCQKRKKNIRVIHASFAA